MLHRSCEWAAGGLKQNIGGWVNLAVYYLIALSLALWLCFGPADLEFKGRWIGCVVGSGLISLFGGLYAIHELEIAIEEVRETEHR